MVSDLNTPSSSKLLLVSTIVAIVISVAVVLLYLSARQASFAKTEPYNVTLQLQGKEGSMLNAEYDYGYGYNRGHQQTFDITSSQQHTINFTISAWKALFSLRFSSTDHVAINRIIISKNGASYNGVDSTTVISDLSPLVLDGLTEKLLGAK